MKKILFFLFALVVIVSLACSLPVAIGLGAQSTRTPWIVTVTNTPFQMSSTAIPVVVEPTATPTLVSETWTVIGSSQWSIAYFPGATDQMKAWEFQDLVKDWDKFPNVDLPKYQFLAQDGVEYGMAESAYCQRFQKCDVNIPAMHYRLVTGDYTIPGVDSCTIDEGAGCGIMLINVGTVTAMFRESSIDYGFTVEGRYWNGDAMPIAIRALLSHVAYNMLNVGGNLLGINFPVNQGANCSSAFGCQKVRLVFAVTSGNELLMKGLTTVSR